MNPCDVRCKPARGVRPVPRFEIRIGSLNGGHAKSRLAAAIVVALAALVALPVAAAQTFPARPIRMIVGFPPGGAVDILARILAKRLGESAAAQIVVDNRAGAGSVIATEIAAKAAADGYTLLLTASSIAVNAGLQKTSYDPVKDFSPAILVASAPNVLVAHPAFAAKNINQLIELARAKPGQLNYASGGNGSLNHLSGELLKLITGIQLTHVPYKGAAPALNDVMSGQVALLFSSLPGALSQIKAGRVNAIAVTSAKRSAVAPEIPTVAESGVRDYDATNWYGVLAPAATSAQIIAKLNSDIARALRTADVVESVTRQGADVMGGTPGDFALHLKSEIAKWTKVVRAVDIRAE